MNEGDTVSYPNLEHKCESEKMLQVIPEELFDKGASLAESMFEDQLLYPRLLTLATVNAARDFMPKGTFVIWDNSREEYVAYVRDAEGKDVEPPVEPSYGKTTTQAITRAMIAYYGGSK